MVFLIKNTETINKMYLLKHILTWCTFISSVAFSQQTNIFKGPYYVNPTFQDDIQRTISQTQDAVTVNNLKQIINVGSAYWIDRKSKIYGSGTNSLEGILKDASRYTEKQTVVFIFYDLPNRDCNARASNGEICCTYRPDKTCNYLSLTDNCDAGLTEYKTTYVDPFVNVISQYQDKVNIAIVIEPDSLPNIITNLGNPACVNSKNAYVQGISYAVQQFAQKSPRVWLYLDAAHGGWLGWKDTNMVQFVNLLKSMNIVQHLRGFSTNVANYQPIGKMCPQIDWCLPHNNRQSDECCNDPCKLSTQYNGCVNELNYVKLLGSYFPDKYFIIDTGRNGVPNARQDCANWCNPRNTGLGIMSTPDTGYPMIDAFFWLKTPGESDGCTQTLPDGKQCPRFDSMCASVDSLGSQNGEPRAPEAGGWFLYQIQMLAKNANFGNSRPPTPSPRPPTPSPSPQPPVPQPTPNPRPPTPSPSPQPPVPQPNPNPRPPTPSPSPQPPVPSPQPNQGIKEIKCNKCNIINNFN
jgi:cellulose 1,4-beta-cellobiosidase